MLFTGLGRSVLGETLPSVGLSTAEAVGLGRYSRPRDIVSPNTVRPRPVNNKYVSLVYKDVKPKKYKFFTVFCLRKTGIVILDNKKSSK